MPASRDPYFVSSDPKLLDVGMVHRFLTNCYWARGIPRSLVARCMRNSLCFGAYRRNGRKSEQVGFARVVTDYATYGYIADVFVLPQHRGRQLGKRLMRAIMEHPKLQGFRRWGLVTKDAHGLYRQFGFKNVKAAAKYHMQIYKHDMYRKR
ncbi:MAG TPA: GNAT family N-acetyltransferase [Terriglobales bacterium]|nr:GNAT family N-acetyltransferase [Terriglobales bacterium]